MVMRIAHIDAAGRVANISLAESLPEPDERDGVFVPAGTAKIGDQYVDGRFVTPPSPPPTADEVRAERNRRLAESVDTFNPVRWAAMTEEARAAWSVYRQALLDVPQQSGFPEAVTWPDAPV
jgi:hypothetical protein